MATFVPRATKRLRLSSTSDAVTHRCSSRGFPTPRCFSTGHPSQTSQQEAKRREDAEKTTHFGFETVAESMKESRVGAVFSSVASSYDTMNDLMSLGIHRLWKDRFVRSLDPGSQRTSATPLREGQGKEAKGWHILDIAGGTGDIAFRMLDHATQINKDTFTRVTVADINTSMLAEGRKRGEASVYAGTDRLSFIEANAETLPPSIEANSIDLYTVAFGIRNFTHKEQALKEAFRVLKPGGVFACLEFSKVDSRIPLFGEIYRRWSFGAIPLIGQIVAGDRDSYQYLVESIERFPDQRSFRDMIREAGFLIPGETDSTSDAGWEDLTGGIAAIHKGVKPIE